MLPLLIQCAHRPEISGLDADERLATQPALHWQEGLRVRAVPP